MQYVLDGAPQVQRGRIFEADFGRPHVDRAGGMSVIVKAGAAARLGLVGIDRKGLVVAAARMDDVIDAAAERAAANSPERPVEVSGTAAPLQVMA